LPSWRSSVSQKKTDSRLVKPEVSNNLRVRGIGNKISELETHLLPLTPHIICITEHHLSNHELDNISINHYKLGASYYRTICKYGGVNRYVHESLTMTYINLHRFCSDYDLEATAVKFKTKFDAYCVLCIYRPLAGDFSKFFSVLDSLNSHLHSPHTNLIVCGDININYLQTCSSRNQLDSLMALYNLYGVVDFHTRMIKKLFHC
jgi:exonuclease III